MCTLLAVLAGAIVAWFVGVLLWTVALVTRADWSPAPAAVVSMFWPIAWPFLGSQVLFGNEKLD